MKKLILAVAAVVASVAISSCQKAGDGSAITASIVGTWENTTSSVSALDKDGKEVDLKQIIIDLLKEQGFPEAQLEEFANQSLNTFSNITGGTSRVTFNADGTIKAAAMDEEGKWEEETVPATYKHDGSKLTITASEDGRSVSVEMTVLKLTATELSLQASYKDVMGSVPEAASELTRMFGDYNLIITQNFNRI